MTPLSYRCVVHAQPTWIKRLKMRAKLFTKALLYIEYVRLENWMARNGYILGVNTITNLIPDIYAALDIVSRELVGLIAAVSRSNDLAERVALNQTINVPIVPAIVGGDVTPGPTPPSDGDQNFGNTTMTIDKSRYWPVRWTGEEMKAVGGSGMYPSIAAQQFAQAFRAACNEIESDLASLYIHFSRSYGTPGTAPFGVAGDLSDFAQSLKILDDNGAPGDRQFVAGSAAIASLRGKQSVLFKANEAGTTDLLRRGIIGQVESYDIHSSAQIKTHVKGTGAAYTTTNAGFAVGTTTIPLITGTGTVLAGDVVTFAGDTNRYVVATGIAAPGSIVLAEPGLRQAIPAAATALTVANTSVRNMTFARSAIHLATRPPALPIVNGVARDMADDRVMVADPVSGLSFEVSMYLQYRQVKYEVATAWGKKVITPRHTSLVEG